MLIPLIWSILLPSSLGLLITELQIRGGIEENSKIVLLFLSKNICCDLSLEPS